MGTADEPASLDAALAAADEAIAEGDWARVAELADEILAIDPDQPDGAMFRTLARRQLDRRVDTPAPPAASPGRTIDADDTERRFLTVMFVDLVGSTRISDSLDPEDFAALLERYHGVATAAIESYGGSVVKLLGDGVMAQFGYPRAIEDAPRRACLAALQLVEDVASAATEFQRRFGVAVDCRVGIHSGTAVVQGGDVVGDVPNTAAKLEGAAPTGGVAVSDETRVMLEGLFHFDAIDGVEVVGTTAFALRRPARVRASLRRADLSGTDLVGRAEELAALDRAWRETVAGSGCAVAIVGPAGIGKSRITEEFHRHVGMHHAHWIEGGAVEFRSGRPFHLFTDAIERRLVDRGIEPDAPIAASAALGMSVDEAALVTSTAPPTNLTPAQLRRMTMTTIAGWIDRLVDDRPTVLALEDLHWADPSSLELADEVVRAAADRPLLVLMTSRHPVPQASTTIGLDRLDESERETLMSRLCADLALSAESLRLLAERANGVPLFAQELARAVRDLETPDVDHLLPGSLRDLLAARLDSFGPAKRVAQLASIIGRAFTLPQIVEIDDAGTDVDDALGTLLEGRLVETTSDTGDEYRFAHSLMQDAAYESLLRSERRSLHARAARALVRLDPTTAERSPDLIAHHLTEAGELRQAFDRWMDAGRLAAGRSASREAIAHFGRAEALLDELSETERDDLDYALRIAVANPLTAELGYAAPEVEAAYRKAADLADESGDPDRRFAATRGLASTYLLRAELSRATDLARASLFIAEETGSGDSQLEALSWLGTVDFFAGRNAEALDHLTATAALYDRDEHGRHGFEFGIDPLVLADSHRAWYLHLDGDRHAALELAHAALDHARSLGHSLSVAHALNYVAGLHQMRQEYDEQLRTADEEVTLAVEYGFVHYIHYGRILAGHAATRLGDHRAVDTMISALADRSAAGAALARPYQLYLIADGRASAGDQRAAVASLEEALAVVERTGERWWEPAIAAMLAAALERPG